MRLGTRIAGHDIGLIVSDLNIGILWILAMTSLGIYAIVLAILSWIVCFWESQSIQR